MPQSTRSFNGWRASIGTSHVAARSGVLPPVLAVIGKCRHPLGSFGLLLPISLVRGESSSFQSEMPDPKSWQRQALSVSPEENGGGAGRGLCRPDTARGFAGPRYGHLLGHQGNSKGSAAPGLYCFKRERFVMTAFCNRF